MFKTVKNIAILYAQSRFTPWRENVCNRTVTAIAGAMTSSSFSPTIVHITGTHTEMASFLNHFDLVFNLCYGFHDLDQTQIVKWLDDNCIPHTVGSYQALRIAQDKGLLPDICNLLNIGTPAIIKPEDLPHTDCLVVAKPRFGSCHRGIHIDFGSHIPALVRHETEPYIFQPYIRGREFTVPVIPTHDGSGYQALPPVEILPKNNESGIYIMGQSAGSTIRHFTPEIPSFLREQLMEAALRLHLYMGLKGMSRTDIRVHNNESIYVLDVNAMPNVDPINSFLPAACLHHHISIRSLVKRIISAAQQTSGPVPSARSRQDLPVTHTAVSSAAGITI